MVEGYIANSLPLRKERLNCLLPAEEKEKVGQVNSKNNNQAIKRFDLYVDLSNNSNIPVALPGKNWGLILYGFSQFYVPDLRIENMDATNTGVPVLVASLFSICKSGASNWLNPLKISSPFSAGGAIGKLELLDRSTYKSNHLIV